MTQRKRLLGIAKAYLPEGTVSPNDPAVSPILAAAPSLLGLPPTLVQVGSAEVLVDESIELQRMAKAVDVDVSVQTYEGVLHAWHTFFPLMPKAAHACEQAAAFLAPHLGLAPPADGPTPSSDAEMDAAATRLQAIQRGRASRRVGAAKSPAPRAPTTVSYEKKSDEERDAELAAIKVQAMTRGRSSRKSGAKAALTYGESDKAAKKELKKKASSGKIGYVESTGKLPPGYADMSDEQKEQVAEDMAATKVQALVRGKNSRKAPKPSSKEAGWNSGSGSSGFVTGDDRNNAMARGKSSISDEDAAATRLQGLQRARAARKEAAELKAERDAAATKLASARRGQLARKQVGGQIAATKAAEGAAATALQKSMRGKTARAETQQQIAERKQAATKLQAVRRGQESRRQTAGKAA